MRRLYTSRLYILAGFSLFLILGPSARGEEADAELQAKISAKLKEITSRVASPTIVQAVKAQNNAAPDAAKAVTQQTWKTLSILDPQVRKFTRNEVALFLKSKKDGAVSEAFVSAGDGTKVAFLSKPTNWCHAGKPKHDQPMKGEIWRGPVEVDESTGVQQMQVSVPILDEGKPIGSLVVGLELTKLKD